MTETPHEILRALANPERLAIPGSLARADAVGDLNDPAAGSACGLPAETRR